MRMFALMLMTLTACAETPKEATAAVAAAPAKPATAAPEAASAPVGPDGPEGIKVPQLGAPSTEVATIAAGERVFADRGCGGCHKFGSKLVGPDLTGLFARRSVTWVARMVSDPAVMVKQDPQAKAMFRSLMVEMPKQNVPEADLAPLLAYLKAQGG